MTHADERLRVPYAEYLVREAASDVKHEWWDGEIVAMAGGTPEHAALAMAVGAALMRAIGDKPCRVYSSDLRVRILATGVATYPDVTVVGGKLETHPDDPHAAVNPVLVVEVLSEGTEAKDRGEKAAHYRRIPSLQEIVFVAQDAPRIEVQRRAEGTWELYDAWEGESVELVTAGGRLAVGDVFRDPLVNGT